MVPPGTTFELSGLVSVFEPWQPGQLKERAGFLVRPQSPRLGGQYWISYYRIQVQSGRARNKPW